MDDEFDPLSGRTRLFCLIRHLLGAIIRQSFLLFQITFLRRKSVGWARPFIRVVPSFFIDSTSRKGSESTTSSGHLPRNIGVQKCPGKRPCP